MDLMINEIFYSLQGEGSRAGDPSVFIRVSKCNLTCNFCDTEFETGKRMSLGEILAEAREIAPACNWIVWTGGEPSLVVGADVVRFFRMAGYRQAIETNGSTPIDPGWFDHVCVSPKVAEHVIKKNFMDFGVLDELKYVVRAGQAAPVPHVKARRYYISPMFHGDVLEKETLDHCIRICKENPIFSLSVQQHKAWKVR